MSNSYTSLDAFLATGKEKLTQGPVAIILAEDETEIDTTVRHHAQFGFRAILVLMPDSFAMASNLGDVVHRITHDTTQRDAFCQVVNRIIRAAPGTWLYYCYNAEYLFYPFCETRSVGEMLAFHAEERRDAMLTYVIDLYADDLGHFPDAVSIDHACLDKSGYYALARINPTTGKPRERQLDFFGGLRWRYEEHIPKLSRRIDRISLFRAGPGLTLLPDHTFDDPEFNTYACPWHHNLTAAVCSFRTAKALKRNPGSAFDIETFRWHNSTPFEWHSRQLLDLGLIEPGQWF